MTTENTDVTQDEFDQALALSIRFGAVSNKLPRRVLMLALINFTASCLFAYSQDPDNASEAFKEGLVDRLDILKRTA